MKNALHFKFIKFAPNGFFEFQITSIISIQLQIFYVCAFEYHCVSFSQLFLSFVFKKFAEMGRMHAPG